MGRVRPSDQGGTRRYLARPRVLLAAVMLAVVAMLPVIVMRAAHIFGEFDASRMDVTDNETWVVSQLEVDYLKLALAVERIRSRGTAGSPAVDWPTLWSDVMERFDIYYSRVGTVANKIGSWSEASGDWKESLQVLEQLVLHRDLIASLLDSADKDGGQVRMDALDTLLAATAVDVRDLSVRSLGNLALQANERRKDYIQELRSILIQSMSMVLVMALTSLGAWLLYRQVGIKAAAEQRQRENLFRVFDAKPDAILLTHEDHRIRWMNRAAAELFGIREDEAPGRNALDGFFPGTKRSAVQGKVHPLLDTVRDSGPSTFRDIVRRAGGGTLPVEVTQVRLMAESGDDTTVLFIRDISQTQRALRALRRERRLAEAEAVRYQRFLAVMSHEIRSPLHAIIASLDLARQRPEAAALADLHGIALDAAQVALEEADAVLEIGRAEHEMNTTEPAIFTPADTIRTLVEMNGPAALRRGTQITVEVGPDADGPVTGLRACFWHAVANLLANAVKFTHDGTIRLRLFRTDGKLRVEVVDTGPGISSEQQELIFRDHYTRDPVPGGQEKGAGLGLGVFVSAVQAMSGRYGLDSQIGQGSTFWFTFPAPPAEKAAAVPSPTQAPGSTALPVDLRVLVVDDSHVNRTLIRQMFVSLGMSADLAASGSEAVALARGVAYDLILMDLSMPELDGFGAAAAIRESGASQKASIVALTANVLARQQVEKPGSDFDGLLLKPLRLDELRASLAQVRYRPAASRSDLPPVIDDVAANDVMSMLVPSVIQPLLSALMDEARDLARDLDRGGAEATLSTRFHRVAGSAGMLGAGRLRALALEGEQACKDGKTAPPQDFRLLWSQTLDETTRSWDALLAAQAAPEPQTVER